MLNNDRLKQNPGPRNNDNTWLVRLAEIGLVISALLLGVAASMFLQTTPGLRVEKFLNALFAIDSVQMWWYITRSAGIIAYLLLWFSTAWGLAVSNKILDPILHRMFTFDFHQFISLLAIGFLILHISVLTLDHYLPFTWTQILIPFIAPYRPLWVGIGVISFYLTILVTFTFYIRRRIGMRTFRAIHVLSLIAYLGATLHGLYAGTDSALLTAQLMYKGTLLIVVFLSAYWIIAALQQKKSDQGGGPNLKLEKEPR
jgi:sulfoxide reductase heme-binding subunit YedZ